MLKPTIDNIFYQEKAFKIDTIVKLIAIEIAMIIVLFGGSFLLLSWSQLAATTLIAMSIGLIIIVEIVTSSGYNKSHNEIGAETSQVRQMTQTYGLTQGGPAELATYSEKDRLSQI